MTKAAIFALFLVCTVMFSVTTTVQGRPSHPLMDLADDNRPPIGRESLSESAMKHIAQQGCCPVALCRAHISVCPPSLCC